MQARSGSVSEAADAQALRGVLAGATNPRKWTSWLTASSWSQAALSGGQSLTPTDIHFSLGQPPTNGGLSQVQIAAHLTDGFAAGAQQVNCLRLELWCK